MLVFNFHPTKSSGISAIHYSTVKHNALPYIVITVYLSALACSAHWTRED